MYSPEQIQVLQEQESIQEETNDDNLSGIYANEESPPIKVTILKDRIIIIIALF